MKLISFLLALVAAALIVSAVSAAESPTVEAPTVEAPAVATSSPEALLRRYAALYGVNPDSVVKVATCESGLDPSVQSFARYPNGTREDSWGLVQIHLPAHPHVTKAQATDPEFAAEFIAKNFAKHPNWWSCWRLTGYPPIS